VFNQRILDFKNELKCSYQSVISGNNLIQDILTLSSKIEQQARYNNYINTIRYNSYIANEKNNFYEFQQNFFLNNIAQKMPSPFAQQNISGDQALKDASSSTKHSLKSINEKIRE
jgi:hypothetical protein